MHVSRSQLRRLPHFHRISRDQAVAEHSSKLSARKAKDDCGGGDLPTLAEGPFDPENSDDEGLSAETQSSRCRRTPERMDTKGSALR